MNIENSISPKDLKTRETCEYLICDVQEIPATGGLIKYFETLRDELIIFTNLNGTVEVFSGVCPHIAGEVVCTEDKKLRCRWHGLEFDKDGHSTNSKSPLKLRKYDSFVKEGKIYINYVS